MYLLVSNALSRISLADRIFRCSESRTLWEEVGTWADIRNLVAHEGLWKPPPLPTDLVLAQHRTADAFRLAGSGDLDGGSSGYAEVVGAATELVLRCHVARASA